MKKYWWKEAVIYQIYPRSFMDSDGDGIGDFQGIISKLDYLQTLGIDTIWLSPFYKSPNDDNGYDISDYQSIMEEFGTLADFKELLKEAHNRKMKLIIDLVVNHTSDEHPWFLESKKSKDNPYRDYYIWKDPKNGAKPNNWTSYFWGSAWEYDDLTEQYYLHLFTKKQPDLNWENETVRKEVYDIMRWWLDLGTDGFRIDVANMYSKVPGLPDGELGNYMTGKEHFQNGPRIHEFYREMHKEVLSHYPDVMTVGETADVPIEEAKKYTSEDRQELNMVFQFEHVTLDETDGDRWNIAKMYLPELKKILTKWQVELGKCGWNSLYWANHDQPRSVSRYGDDGQYRKESAKMLYTMLLTMQGTPYIYQGEEIGMTNMKFDHITEYPDVEIQNLWKQRVIKEKKDPHKVFAAIQYRARDNARTPMQWDESPNAGFSSGIPWIKVNPNYKEINVAESLRDPNSIFHYIQKLIKLRKENEVAIYGDFKEYYNENESLYVYLRSYEGKQMFVILNFTGESVKFFMPEEVVFVNAEPYIYNYQDYTDLGNMTVRPYEAAVYLLE